MTLDLKVKFVSLSLALSSPFFVGYACCVDGSFGRPFFLRGSGIADATTNFEHCLDCHTHAHARAILAAWFVWSQPPRPPADCGGGGGISGANVVFEAIGLLLLLLSRYINFCAGHMQTF